MPHNAEKDKRVFLGFWIYLMTDLLMFAVLFATFAVLRNATNGGITIREIFDPPFVLTETLILLTSSFACGIGVIAARMQQRVKALGFLFVTAILGIVFLGMELYEFSHLLGNGHSFTESAFLSAFFSLVGFHGLHIFGGLLWIFILMSFIMKRGLTVSNVRKTQLLGIFWHFLDIVWIFIFTIVYMMGGIA